MVLSKVHNLRWRLLGLMLFVAACACQLARPDGTSGGEGIAAMLMAIAGALLLINGRRAILAVRIEAGRHRRLPAAIHKRMIRRGTPGDASGLPENAR